MTLSVQEQADEKMRLEKTFAPEVKRLFALISADFLRGVASTGQPPNMNRYLPAWQNILDQHYARTQNKFTGMTGLEPPPEDTENLFALALLKWRDDNTQSQSELITQTTIKNVNDSLELGRQALVQADEEVTNRMLAASSTAILKRKFAGRVDGIVMSETQGAAESTKFAEAEVSDGLRPRVLGGGAVVTTVSKTWRTVGDTTVRDIHKRANGQRVRLTEPFIVNGEQLMHPGDTSLGASAGNVVNCRCGTEYSA